MGVSTEPLRESTKLIYIDGSTLVKSSEREKQPVLFSGVVVLRLELIRCVDNILDGRTHGYALVHNEMGCVPVQASTNHHSRPRLIILLLLVAGVLSILYYPYNSPFNPASAFR